MALRVRAMVVAVLLGAPAAACGGGGGDDDADLVAATTTTRERTLTVCGVEEEIDRINAARGAADYAEQRRNAIRYLDAILAIRAKGRPAADIAADYASVTEAYEVVRSAFDVSTTADDYLAEVERSALAAFGTPEEVDRFEAAYTAWVIERCGFDPQTGIELFAADG